MSVVIRTYVNRFVTIGTLDSYNTSYAQTIPLISLKSIKVRVNADMSESLTIISTILRCAQLDT